MSIISGIFNQKFTVRAKSIILLAPAISGTQTGRHDEKSYFHSRSLLFAFLSRHSLAILHANHVVEKNEEDIETKRSNGRWRRKVLLYENTDRHHEMPIIRQMLQDIDYAGCFLLGDKAYSEAQWKARLNQQGIHLLTPVKIQQGDPPRHPCKDALETGVSRTRASLSKAFSTGSMRKPAFRPYPKFILSMVCSFISLFIAVLFLLAFHFQLLIRIFLDAHLSADR